MKIKTKKLEDGTTVVEGMTSAELLALAKKRADAGDGTFIKLAKRAGEAAGFSHREAALQRACDLEVQRMRAESIAKRDAKEPLSEYEAYRKSLHESAPAPHPAPAAPPRDESCVRQVQQIGHGESGVVHSGQREQHPSVRSERTIPSSRPSSGGAPRAAAVKDVAATAAALAKPARSVLDRASTVLG